MRTVGTVLASKNDRRDEHLEHSLGSVLKTRKLISKSIKAVPVSGEISSVF